MIEDLVITKVDNDDNHLFIGIPEVGSVEVLIQDDLAYVYDLRGSGQAEILKIVRPLMDMLQIREISEVFLHTSPTEDELEQHENRRLSDIYSKRYGFEPLYVVRRKVLK